MAFMGILAFLGIFSVILITILLIAGAFMLWGIIDGLVVSRAGKKLSKNEQAAAKRPGFIRAARALSTTTAILCAVAIASTIAIFVVGFTAPAPYEQHISNTITILSGLGVLSFLLGFLLLAILGPMQAAIYQFNQKLAPSALPKPLSITCLVLGIITMVACTLMVLVLAALMILVG